MKPLPLLAGMIALGGCAMLGLGAPSVSCGDLKALYQDSQNGFSPWRTGVRSPGSIGSTRWDSNKVLSGFDICRVELSAKEDEASFRCVKEYPNGEWSKANDVFKEAAQKTAGCLKSAEFARDTVRDDSGGGSARFATFTIDDGGKNPWRLQFEYQLHRHGRDVGGGTRLNFVARARKR